MITSKYFKESEFQRCTPACSLQDMQQSTMDMLDRARGSAGIPFVLNSAYRSATHERSMGKAGTSAHTLGCAVDIRCNTEANRWKIVAAAIQVGFKRIGIDKKFIHLDNSTSHTNCVIWFY